MQRSLILDGYFAKYQYFTRYDMTGPMDQDSWQCFNIDRNSEIGIKHHWYLNVSHLVKFPVIYKVDNIDIFVLLLMEINWKQLRTESISMQIDIYQSALNSY